MRRNQNNIEQDTKQLRTGSSCKSLDRSDCLMRSLGGVTICCAVLLLCLSSPTPSQADSSAAKQHSSKDSQMGGLSSMLVGSLMNYFDTSALSAASEQPKVLANWSPSDDSRKQQVLRDLINKASVLIEYYQANGLRNAPNLPVNIPGFGAVMKTPDKLLRAELSMLQDLIKMAQKMIQNPLSATMELPKDLAVLMSRMAIQVEQ